MTKQEEELRAAVSRLQNKDFGIYFFTVDTHGNALASIATIYEHVKVLNELGYKATILHEKNAYHGVGDWLGEEYMQLPHVSIESKTLKTGPYDFIIIPEVFATFMDQVKALPPKKIVMCQSYDYILEVLPLAVSWQNYNINDVICTSEKVANYVKKLFPSIETSVIPVGIPSYFKPTSKIKIPEVAICSRNQQDAAKIIKAFYLRHPMFGFITFREIRGIPRKQVAEILANCCAAVWIDDISGFGTFPVECFETETPVIGKIPNLIPEWMEQETVENGVMLKENGLWTNDLLSMPDIIAQAVQRWLEDVTPEILIENIKNSKGHYTEEKQRQSIELVYGKYFTDRINELSSLADKFAEAEQKALSENGITNETVQQ